MKKLTAQQKSDRGLTLSSADIQELLKDPNSWVAKLYADCLLVAEINHAEFIHLVHKVMLEQKIIAQQIATKELEHHLHIKSETTYYAEQYAKADKDFEARKQQPIASLPALKHEMAVLLALPQAKMNLHQLAAHHQQLTTNFNNQVTARLGKTITLPFATLAVPQYNAKPAISAPRLVAVSPALKQNLAADSKLLKPFAMHATKTALGYLAVLNKWQEILAHNQDLFLARGIDADKIILTPAMLKTIDKAVKLALEDNGALLACLLENNERALAMSFPAPSTAIKLTTTTTTTSVLTSKPTSGPLSPLRSNAMFAPKPRPTPGKAAKRLDDHEPSRTSSRIATRSL